MIWLRTLLLFDQGQVSASPGWRQIHDSFVRSIQSIHFPPGSGGLTLKRKMRLANSQWSRNGVGFLKASFLQHLVHVEGWQPEAGLSLETINVATEVRLYPSMDSYVEPVVSSFGPFDFMTVAEDGLRVAIEWETGNISSSHRSMNKLALAIEMGLIDAGVLIVPSRLLYQHLTDRIGNITELSGYLAMWKRLGDSVARGLLSVVVVEHDALTDDGDYLPVGRDGRAAQGRARLV